MVKSQQPSDDQDRARAAGLRRVAVASVAALAVALPLAAVTASAEHSGAHRGSAAHGRNHRRTPPGDE